MGILTQALHFAADAHGDDRRKGDGSPAILHAAEAAAIAATLTGDEEVLAAALLHDTVEDAGVAPEELRARFGDRVARLVAAETEDKMRQLPPDQSWRSRKEATVAHLRDHPDRDVYIVVLGDKLSNLRSLYRGVLARGADFWSAFHQRDPAQHHWYYRAIADLLAPLAHTPAWQEYDRLIRLVFEQPERRCGGDTNPSEH